MTIGPDTETERLVKSAERVRDLGEVFTPAATVQKMLDLLPDAMWEPHPAPTFLEPACGDGNFLVAILDRKLDRIAATHDAGELPAGLDRDAVQFHALEALASIYAFDISVDNIVGGTPGHEVGARGRLVTHLVSWYLTAAGGRLTNNSLFLRSAKWITERNVQVANMLQTNADGSSSHREDLQLIEYEWDPSTKSVSLSTTSFGAVMDAGAVETSGALTLFGTPAPVVAWSGKSTRLHEAPISAPVVTVMNARNGNGPGRR